MAKTVNYGTIFHCLRFLLSILTARSSASVDAAAAHSHESVDAPDADRMLEHEIFEGYGIGGWNGYTANLISTKIYWMPLNSAQADSFRVGRCASCFRRQKMMGIQPSLFRISIVEILRTLPNRRLTVNRNHSARKVLVRPSA